MSLQQRLLDDVGGVDRPANRAVELQSGQQAQVLAVVLQGAAAAQGRSFIDFPICIYARRGRDSRRRPDYKTGEMLTNSGT